MQEGRGCRRGGVHTQALGLGGDGGLGQRESYTGQHVSML